MASLCSNLHPPFLSLVLPRQNTVSSWFFINGRVKFNLKKVSTTRRITCKKASSRGPDNDRFVRSKIEKTVAKQGDKKFVHEGLITESLPNGMFRVLLDNQDLILGYLSGKIRKNFVRVLPGDRVRVELSPYDSTKGRIVYRLRNKDASG
ncbi:Nucleic acid-binding isoform 1 [Theobroma cacao]|uniref:Translation initiation factor IF-1, chloroplastic n=1 Tax=Theobroma cacao TaxID=3641 RepID=A0A061GCW8_THECC|nr:Nucleic acid-binding isoform 1 [Theobroma cacao]EOY24904.1 Nucleic acid-binding isoform 1 [Theobroma cacao]EOY24905.1 Nucleic acid-binding isoform 1 [Theobroma cacao]